MRVQRAHAVTLEPGSTKFTLTQKVRLGSDKASPVVAAIKHSLRTKSC